MPFCATGSAAISSASKRSVAPGGIVGGEPDAPYA